MILFSGRNIKVCIIRWLMGGVIPFRLPVTARWEKRVLLGALSYGVPFRAYGFNNLGVDYLPAPPVEQVSVNTDFGIAPLELLGKVFAYTFKPTLIGGRSISLTGYMSLEFLPEILSLVWNLDGETPQRRYSREPTPEYGIQLTATSALPEFLDYCFVVEAHMAIPTRVSLRGSQDRPLISFDLDFFVPYTSWYTDRLAELPSAQVYSEQLFTIRDIQISSPSPYWGDLLGLIYGFSLTVTKAITPTYTFPESWDLGVGYGVPTLPYVADEWGSVAQCIKEGLVSIRLELVCGLASDINLVLSERYGGNIYYYTREYFPLEINFGGIVGLRAAAMVTDLSINPSPEGAAMLRASLQLSEPIYIIS